MDDKEKEKFGVIIDKNDQGTDNQPKVDDTSVNPDINKESKISELENKTPSEEKQPESDIKTETDATTQSEGNLNENKDESPEKDKPDGSNDVAETSEEKKEHQVIHKKDGRLHIYVRQDKYKGELKSRNWVGRLYIDGKQKISSSGTPNLEEAIPILEKWFDDVHKQKEREQKQIEQQKSDNVSSQPNLENSETPEVKPSPNEEIKPKSPEISTQELINQKINEIKQQEQNNISFNQKEETDNGGSKVQNIFNKLKNIKLKTPSFGKKDSTSPKLNFDKNKVKEKFNNFLKSRLGKKTAQGEEIVGVEITNKEIRLAQISSNKANQWVLDRFYTHAIDLPEDSAIVDHEKKVSEELNIALQKSKISTPNAAITARRSSTFTTPLPSRSAGHVPASSYSMTKDRRKLSS